MSVKRLQAEIIRSHDYVCCWSIPGTPLLEFVAMLQPVRQLVPMTVNGRAI